MKDIEWFLVVGFISFVLILCMYLTVHNIILDMIINKQILIHNMRIHPAVKTKSMTTASTELSQDQDPDQSIANDNDKDKDLENST